MPHFPYRVLVEWSNEDQVYVARVPALPVCMAHGESPEDAIREARIGAEGILAVMAERGSKIPEPDVATDYSGQIRLRMPRGLHRRLAERAAADEVSLNQCMVAILAAAIEKA